MNMARVAALRAGFPDTVPGVTINRFCSSGLQAIAMAAEKIRSGGAEIIIAGGSESMSLLPMSGHKFAPNPWMVDHLPQIYMGMGLTAEAVYQKYKRQPQDQDAFSFRSHQNALAAQAAGKFDDEIVPLDVETTTPQGSKKAPFAKDEGPRADTRKRPLAKLRPVFHATGTSLPANSSQTSDGAAAAIVMSESKARALGLKPMARFRQLRRSAACRPRSWASGPSLRSRKRSSSPG